MGLKETIEKILEYEARSLSYSSRGTPIIWDEPQCKEDAEVERRIELLDRESVFEAVRRSGKKRISSSKSPDLHLGLK